MLRNYVRFLIEILSNQTFILFTYEEMEIEELKDYYKARVEPYGKSMSEIMEEVAKETKAYKELEEENKKLKEEVKDLIERNIELDKKYMLVLTENKKLKEEKEIIMRNTDGIAPIMLSLGRK